MAFQRLKLKMNLRDLFFKKTEDTRIQFFRSLFIGGVATVVDFGATAFVRELIFGGKDSWSLRLLYVCCGFIAGLTVNFILSRIFVFDRARYETKKEFVAFAAIGIIGLGLNYGIISLFSLFMSLKGMVFYGVKLVATLVTFMWNFFARKKLIYTL